MPWCCGEEGEKLYQGTEIGRYDKMAAELRDEELQLLAAGDKPPHLDEIEGLQIPLSTNVVPKKNAAGKSAK
jgi:hypothetical protein